MYAIIGVSLPGETQWYVVVGGWLSNAHYTVQDSILGVKGLRDEAPAVGAAAGPKKVGLFFQFENIDYTR